MQYLNMVADYYKTAFSEMGLLQAIAQGVGFVALFVSFFIFQQKEKGRTLGFKLADDLLWAGHYFLLGPASYAAACLNCVCVLRELIFMQRGKKRWASHVIWLPIFILINWAFAAVPIIWGVKGDFSALTTADAYQLFSILGTTMAVIGLYVKSPRLMRAIMLPAQILWLIYSVIVVSIPATISNSIMIVSILISILRYDILQRRKKA